ncbi:MAG: exopolyphosphatase [Brumimicrobium sp.]|nr:exopolyphosphatase [Brumimicrobium sp.]
MKYAAIDIGTNAARLLIGEVKENKGVSQVKKISYTRVPLRLGMEVFTNGVISPGKTEEFLKTMKAFKLLAEVYHVAEIQACATSAMREASNGKEVKKKILKETGLNIAIIDGEEEAKTIFSTFSLIVPDDESAYLVIDVGGGSTEISIFENDQRIAGRSFNVGTLRLLKEKVDAQVWTGMKKWINSVINKKIKYKVFATGGNINKIHKLLNKQFLQPVKISEFKKLYVKLEEMSFEERVEEFNLKPDRADVIVPACQIYAYVFKQLKCKEIYVPRIGLSDGMIYEMHKKQSAY